LRIAVGLRDIIGRKRILARVARLEQGNYGDCAPVGEGVSELRLFFGPGYRVYFGEDAGNIIILLCGGDKSTQARISKRPKHTGQSIKSMRSYRTFGEAEEEYLRNHPAEIDNYITVLFEEYARDNDTGALLTFLRRISRVKGITATTEAAGMTRKGLQKALSKEGNPKFENINAIMHAIGYRLAPQRLGTTATK
jgi:putative addiction module killer protein/probable addiction module antidote protein